MNIVFLVFGDKFEYHLQTYFSILSVLAVKKEDEEIVVYSDRPQLYARLTDYVEIVPLDEATLKTWINDSGYVFRAKIKAIEHCALHHPDEPVLFLDGDTIMRHDFSGLRALLEKGIGVMYVDEGHPSRMKGPSLRMWKAMKGEVIDGVLVDEKQHVWNSGVLGIPASLTHKIIPLAVRVCDVILSKHTRCFIAEQYAFAIAMTEYCPLHAATDWVWHYWGNKEEWLALADKFVMESYMKNESVDQEIARIRLMDFSSIPVYVKKSTTRRRLTNFIAKLFPDKRG